MGFLRPNVVARAAHALFNNGEIANAYSLPFFFLKAAGASPDQAVAVLADNIPSAPLRALAGQPDGYEALVAQHWDEVGRGLPTKAGQGGGTSRGLFWPLCDTANILMRKNESQRSAVQTNLSRPHASKNDEEAAFDSVYVRNQLDGTLWVRFTPDYVRAAAWFLSPAAGRSMRVPLRPMSVWMARLRGDLTEDVTIEELIQQMKLDLHLTAEELAVLFDEAYAFELGDAPIEPERSVEDYFRALVLEPADVAVLAPRPYDAQRELEPARYELSVQLYGLRNSTSERPDELAELLIGEGRRNLLLYGPPRTGKSQLALRIASAYLGITETEALTDTRITRVQFHPGWTYGDFIRKLSPTVTNTQLGFERTNGVFLKHCRAHSDHASVVIVDEINRASIPTVFGESFQVIEEGRRGQSVELLGTLPSDDCTSLSVPATLLLVATANNLDRSTLEMDFAFLERFAVVDCGVRYDDALRTLQSRPGWTESSARSFIMNVVAEVVKQSGFPIGHAHFYSIGSPDTVSRWYRTSLRPSVAAYLTQFRKDELLGLDDLFASWRPTQ